MEIDAQVYIITDQKDLLPKAGKNLSEWIHNSSFRLVEEMEPSAALPLSRVWYSIIERAEPTYGPYKWRSSLQQCADLLGKHGTVIVEYRSPDYPDNYLEYAITTSGGNVSISSRLTLALANWKKSLGNDDLSLVLNELMKGSTSYDRCAAAKRTEKKAAERAARGDFDIVDGKLVKYRGINEEETIPEGVTVIGNAAFTDLNQLEKYFMCEIDDYEAPPLTNLVIPEGVHTIETYALAYCTNLRSVSIPSTVTVIGERAFEGCEELQNISLPEGIKTIEPCTFFLCENLRTVTLPEGLEVIGENAFDSCSSLKKIVIPKSVKEIGKEAFSQCSSLEKVVLPEGLENIGKDAFKGCGKLKQTRS